MHHRAIVAVGLLLSISVIGLSVAQGADGDGLDKAVLEATCRENATDDEALAACLDVVRTLASDGESPTPIEVGPAREALLALYGETDARSKVVETSRQESDESIESDRAYHAAVVAHYQWFVAELGSIDFPPEVVPYVDAYITAIDDGTEAQRALAEDPYDMTALSANFGANSALDAARDELDESLGLSPPSTDDEPAVIESDVTLEVVTETPPPTPEPTPTPQPTPIPEVDVGEASYLMSTPDVVHFVRWTSDGTNILGSLTVFERSTFEPEGGYVQQHDFTGLIAGGSVTLRFIEDDSVINGQIEGDSLVLVLPDGSGGFVDLRYEHSDQGEYEATIAQFEEAAAIAIAERDAARQRDAPVTEAADRLAEAVEELEQLISQGIAAPYSPEQVRKGRETVMGRLGGLDDELADLRSMLQVTKVADVRADLYYGRDYARSDFDVYFGIGYRSHFCKNKAFSPEGTEATTYKAQATEQLSAVLAVFELADELDVVVAANPEASAPDISTSEARALAQAHFEQVQGETETWRSAVETAKEIRGKARKLFNSARRKYQQAGVTIPSCREVTWAPGI